MDKQLKINSDTADAATSHLRQEYEAQQALARAQPAIVQRFLETQARPLAEAVLQKLPQVHFKLPDRVVCDLESVEKAKPLPVPTEFREQMAGGLVVRLVRTDLRAALHQRLVELEESQDKAVAVSAGLIRYTTVAHMVHGMLPAGRSVTYAAAEGEEIPSIPVGDELEPESAITAKTDAIVEEGQGEAGRGELIVPYVPAARRFYLPQWVAFDDRDELLVNSVQEAEAHIASMQRFLEVLHAAVGLAPYIIADDEYQQKRYGMLGQLVNQGRALARYETGEIIRTINRRADTQDLNRGLSLSLPYFDDQDLEMKIHDFEVIPAGRIMFVPAFVVRATRMEEAKIAQDTRLSPSTRKHLLAELKMLEQAFDSSSGS
ncbi:MAG TPA: hypothetical protein VI755_15130 [Anaerolineales bacterium]|nr:hypothetical protein [Anaerolineales bacterium]